MNLFKKTTAGIALLALTSSIFSIGAYANDHSASEAANILAAKGYINSQADVADYNLNQNVLRQEIAKVAANIAGIEAKTTCDNSFADVTATTPNTWACGYAEALLDAGKISANENFRPEDNISKSEAVKMVLEAAGYTNIYTNANNWQEEVVSFAVNKGIVPSFSNYNTPATRGFIFTAAAESIVEEEKEEETSNSLDDLINSLLGEDEEITTDNGTDTTGTDTTGTDTTNISSGSNELIAELSANTPTGIDLPEGATGVEVLIFDVTAGSEDVSITGIELERTGFGESAADEVAVYTEEGRVSKIKSFSDSDDVANLTFSPAVVIKAGETKTLTAKVNTTNANGEFAISVKNINASATVSVDTITSDYFEVKNVNATELEITNQGVNASVIAGEQQADIAEFKLTNNGTNGTSVDADITITSITLEEIGTIDQEDVLENFTLNVNGNVISTVYTIADKYITFNFDPFVIGDDKNETFTVKADIMGGAGDNIQIVLDNKIDITATSSKYNAVKILPTDSTFGTVDVDAGELSIYAIDADIDEIRQDKTNVVLGQLKIVNVAGQSLELQDLGININTTNSGVLEVLENVEFEVNGTSYDLSTTATTSDKNATFSDNDLDIILAQGTTILTIRADTLDNLTDGTTVTLSLDADNNNDSTYSNFRIEETEEDVLVTDITPSSLSWRNVEVVQSAATISNVPLANVEVVKGAADLVALQFEIEAGKASYVTTDRIKVTLNTQTGAVTKNEVSEIALYQGYVSESNLLDKVSGTKLDTNGAVTFDGFEVEVAIDSSETFIVTITTVDTEDVVGAEITASINNPSTDIALEDDENDTVTLASSTTLSDKVITVRDSGILTLIPDANNIDNEDAKTILAGEESIIYSIDAIATNEEVNAETVVFTLNGDLKNVVSSAKLYLDDVVVATATNSDITTGSSTITFDNISNLDFPTVSSELKLAIVTETIGYEKIGNSVANISVTNVAITDAEGVDSAELVTITPITVTESNTFAVVPAKLTLSLVKNLSEGTAKVKVTVDTGNNTALDNASAPTVTLTDLTVLNKASGGALSIYEEGESTAINFLSGGIVISNDKTFEIVPQDTTAGNSYTLSIPTTGAEYSVESNTGFTINMTNELDLGTISYN